MKRFRLFKKEETESKIDIGPLLDMVFILLIFFVVTTTFTRQTGVEVKKPKASSAKKIEGKTLLIGITREGTIHIHEKAVDFDMLENILRQEVSKSSSVRAVIVADKESASGRVVETIDRCNIAGISDVSLAASKD